MSVNFAIQSLLDTFYLVVYRCLLSSSIHNHFPNVYVLMKQYSTTRMPTSADVVVGLAIGVPLLLFAALGLYLAWLGYLSNKRGSQYVDRRKSTYD
jgi:hypothetical protein